MSTILEFIRTTTSLTAVVAREVLSARQSEERAARDRHQDNILALDKALADLDTSEPSSDETDQDETPAPARFVRIGPTKDEIIIDHLRLNGPSRIDQLQSAILKVTGKYPIYQTVYGHVCKGPNSMVGRGVVAMDRSDHPVKIVLKPDYKPGVQLDRYVAAILSADPRWSKDDQLVTRFAEAVGVYTEHVIWPRNGGKRLHAGHTWKAVKNRGLVGAISVMVEGATTPGFAGLAELNRPELTAEQIVLDFPRYFSDSVINSARLRLQANETTKAA